MKFGSMVEILDYAISKEEEASSLYYRLADTVKFPNMRQVFLDFAEQEEKHKANLLKIKAGGKALPSDETVRNLGLADYLVEIKVSPDINYQQALIVAMQAEKNSYVMYSMLAEAAADPDFRKALLGLAAEEANHKLRFEMEYDAQFMTEN